MSNYYPSWICYECAYSNGGRFPENHVATFHEGKCGWCGRNKVVTEPRDYGFPPYVKKDHHITCTDCPEKTEVFEDVW